METTIQPRIRGSMSAAEYHADPSCSASKLKAMRRSPAHCRYQMDNPPTSEAMALGSLLHSMVLEPDVVCEHYLRAPKCDRRTKAGKDTWAATQTLAMLGSKTIVDDEDFDLAMLMAAACRRHPAFDKLFRVPGHNELSIFWRDEPTGLDCKMRADRIVDVPGFGTVCVDLKTTTNAGAFAFGKSVNGFGYHIQGAMYLHALAIAGIPCEKFVIMAVESAAPHCVAVYALDDETIEQGWRECRRLMTTYALCVKSGEWPGYSNKIESLGVPFWAMDDDI